MQACTLDSNETSEFVGEFVTQYEESAVAEETPIVSDPPTWVSEKCLETAYAELQSEKHVGVMNNSVKWMRSVLPVQYQNYEDLMSNVEEWSVEAANRYDGRNKFVTFLVTHLRMRAWNYVRGILKERKKRKQVQVCDDMLPLEAMAVDMIDSFESMRFDEFRSSLTPEASFVLHLILENAQEIAALGHRAKPRAGEIARYLDISRSAVVNALTEIQCVHQECI